MDVYPTIPREEFTRRRRSFQERMTRENIDLLIVNSNDRSVSGPANVRYLTNFAAHFEPVCCLIPVHGESSLVTGPESQALAQVSAEIEHIRVAQEYAHPEEDYPWAKIESLKDIILSIEKEMKRPLKRAGVIGYDFIDRNVLKMVSSEFELVSAEHLMNEMRSIKSQNEIEVIKYTFKIAQEGLQAALGSIREGVREFEIAAEAEYAMRKMGSEGTGIDTMVGSGAELSRPIMARTTSRKIRSKEIIQLSVIPKYEGYQVCLGRPASIGQPDKRIVEAAEVAQRAQDEIIENLKPGNLGREVESKGRRIMAENKLDSFFAYIGLHSLGLIEFEPPIFFSRSDEEIRENMVLSVDLPCFFAPWGGFRLEDGYWITSRGGLALDTTQRGLIVLDR